MKIVLVCSHGGHLTEILYLMEAFEGHDIFFITYNNLRTRELNYNKYLLDNIGTNPIKMSKAFFEIAIPAFLIGKMMGIKNVFIESWCRVNTKSGTGKIVYFFSDLFLVQWPELLKLYGKKAQYKGAVI